MERLVGVSLGVHMVEERRGSSTKVGMKLRWGVGLCWLPALLVVVPILMVLSRAFEPGGEAWAHVVESLLAGYVWQTGMLVGLVLGLALVLGVPTAWWMATCDFRGKWVLRWALVLPLAMPGYVAALAYADAVQGLVPVYVWVRQQFGVEAFLLAQQVARWSLAVVVMGATLYPYVYLTALASFSRQAAASLEAARMLGVGPWKIFWRVALPMSRPAVVAGSSLVVFETLNDYGVSHYFGISSLTVGVFRAWLSEGHLHVAIRLALLLLAFAMAGVLMERGQRGRRGFEGGSGEVFLTPRRVRGWRGMLVLLGCLVPVGLGFLVPGVRLGRWAWATLGEAFGWETSLRAAWHSFSLAGGASVLIVLGALLVVAGRRLFGAPSLRWAQRVGLIGYALPSALVAVGVGAMVAMISKWPGMGWTALSASVLGLVFAYYTRFLAVGIQPVDAGFRRISGSLHEVSRTLGMGPWRTLWRVDLPLVWPSLLAGATLAFVDIFKELTLTLVLRPFDFETLATLIVRLTDESRIPEAAVPALILVILSLVGLIPLTHLSMDSGGRRKERL